MRKIKVSTASEHDTLHFKEVLDPANTNCNIFANKGYVNGEREERLGKQGWRMQIQRKGSQDKPISGAQERRNKRIAKTRARIEHVFAGIAQLGGKAPRTIGLARATLQLTQVQGVQNGRRRVRLTRERVKGGAQPALQGVEQVPRTRLPNGCAYVCGDGRAICRSWNLCPRTPYRPFPGSRRRRKAIARSGAAPAVGATGTTEMAQNEKSPLGSGLFLYCEFLEARTGIEPV